MMSFVDPGPLIGHLKSGRVKALAHSGVAALSAHSRRADDGRGRLARHRDGQLHGLHGAARPAGADREPARGRVRRDGEGQGVRREDHASRPGAGRQLRRKSSPIASRARSRCGKTSRPAPRSSWSRRAPIRSREGRWRKGWGRVLIHAVFVGRVSDASSASRNPPDTRHNAAGCAAQRARLTRPTKSTVPGPSQPGIGITGAGKFTIPHNYLLPIYPRPPPRTYLRPRLAAHEGHRLELGAS